ncbi:hypothetical protein BpHYR1_026790 [Brachionus plicatilis]|uniref:Uncharacterized protein n=1 Tax=Brachionus plicatilis TaxID=10195 RepID=A0A3M7QP97_BRAPC|nr:hypothetical protein BpHYR1_026790 [Brachionus plicatilis]
MSVLAWESVKWGPYWWPRRPIKKGELFLMAVSRSLRRPPLRTRSFDSVQSISTGSKLTLSRMSRSLSLGNVKLKIKTTCKKLFIERVDELNDCSPLEERYLVTHQILAGLETVDVRKSNIKVLLVNVNNRIATARKINNKLLFDCFVLEHVNGTT